MSISKKQRQHQIIKIISENIVSSQVGLVKKLGQQGIEATQTTVSRDLEEVGAIKVRAPGSGNTVYAVPELPADQIVPEEYLQRVMGEWVVEIKRSGDLIILKTPPGCAHVVASAIDRSGFELLIGTVGGDDSVLAIAEEGSGSKVAAKLATAANIELK